MGRGCGEEGRKGGGGVGGREGGEVEAANFEFSLSMNYF